MRSSRKELGEGRAEIALRCPSLVSEGTDIHRHLIEAVRDYAIYALDLDGTILTWNPGAEQMKGYRANEIIGKNYSRFFLAKDVKDNCPARELEEAAKTGRFREENWRVRKDGTRFWAEVILTPIFGPDGLPKGFVKVTRDLTERYLREEELRQAKTFAERANNAKAVFLANMSHELRTPLNAIIGFSEIMTYRMFGSLNARYCEYAEMIHASGKHLLALINDVLDLAKLEAGKTQLKMSVVDLKPLILSATKMLGDQAIQAGVSLKFENPRDCRITCDPQRVRQIFVNLLSNAIKFTQAGGEVAIELDVLEGVVEIRVRDSGAGMSPAEVIRAFERFGHSESRFSNASRGMGLGLPIARELAELHGGSLALRSMPGVGTTAIVRLPL